MLHYHKCNDCLTAFSSTERKIDFCDCNGLVTYMGQVHGTDYVKTEMKAACDGRCTHASGPVCDCQCGGLHHGTGKLVSTIVDQGKVKAVGLTEQDVERAHMFRKLRDYADKLYTNKYPEDNGQWLERSDWRAKITMRKDLDKIKKMKIYDARHKALVAFISSHFKKV